MIIRCNCCEYLSDDIQDMEGHIKNQHGTSSHSVVVAGINKHREAVREIMLRLGRVIARRSWDHDTSKLEPDELPAYEKYVPLLEAAATAEEFGRLMAEFKPTRDLHKSRNRHHVEFHKNGAEDMDLVDLVEMFADAVSGTRGTVEERIAKLDIPEVLIQILYNTYGASK